MALSLVPYAIAFVFALLIFAVVRKIAPVSSRFSPTAAAIASAPVLVAANDTVASSIFMLVAPVPGNNPSLMVLGRTLFFSAIAFAPTLIVLVPLLTSYLARALRRKRLFSVLLVSTVGACCLALQVAWLAVLADAVD